MTLLAGLALVLILQLIQMRGLHNMSECLTIPVGPQKIEYKWRVGPHAEDTTAVSLEKMPSQTQQEFLAEMQRRISEWRDLYPLWEGE